MSSLKRILTLLVLLGFLLAIHPCSMLQDVFPFHEKTPGGPTYKPGDPTVGVIDLK
jgi:hypothetical protein